VLSPLAEGGDRLVAQVAFDLGLRVIAPLPLPVTQYRDDFDGPESLAIFERQLAQAEPLVLPIRQPHDQDAARLPGPARDRQYAEAGIFVSRHCHILLALWDGDEAASLGGTAHVVRFHLHGEIPGQPDQRRASLSLLGIDENTLVRHIPAARREAVGAQTRSSRWLTAEGETTTGDALPVTFDRMFRCQAAFNADSRKYAGSIAASATAKSEDASCPIYRLFAAADWLARTYQRRVGRVLRITYALAAATGFALILYDHVDAQDAMIYLYLLLFASTSTTARWPRACACSRGGDARASSICMPRRARTTISCRSRTSSWAGSATSCAAPASKACLCRCRRMRPESMP